MRQMFTVQYELGATPIEKVQIPSNLRDSLPNTLRALQHIYLTEELRRQVEAVVYRKIKKGKDETGRKGMPGWVIFVLAVVRNELNISYDRLQLYANYNKLVRGIMGVESNFSDKTYSLQSIKDNVRLIKTSDINKINDLVVKHGHMLCDGVVNVKSDTFVFECNVHFPTDLNLLWDSCRKITDVMGYCREHYCLSGWGKVKYWRRTIKNQSRACGKASVSTSKNREELVNTTVTDYLSSAETLLEKSRKSMHELLSKNLFDYKLLGLLYSLEYYQEMAVKHIDLVYRRLINGEDIPHSEKVFSIFEPHTEWISKGKLGKKVELGLKVLICTDQNHFIVDHKVIQGQADSDLTVEVADRLLAKFDKIQSISFDKGFYSKENKELLKLEIPMVVLPKKGKKNKVEKQEEASTEFKKLRNAHSAVESNINQLEHKGLDRCPDKGLEGFKRYTALGVLAYNLNRLGKILIEKEKQEQTLKKAA